MMNQHKEFWGRLNSQIFLPLLALMLGVPVTANAAATLDEALEDGKFNLDVRLRYENVSHDAFVEDASAATVRIRYGYSTDEFNGFKAFIEGDFTRGLDPDDFNSTINGKGSFPVVADPDSTRLNRLTLSYSGLADTSVTVGRQRIKLDNDRFIGNVGFRQNEQTFDALRVENTSFGNLKFDYTYLWQVNRIFGSQSLAGEWDADTHLLNTSYDINGFGKITGYGYLIDVANMGLSNKTFGIRFKGARKASENVTLTYAAEYAVQKEYAGNMASFDLDYFLVEGGAKFHGFTTRVGFEQLEGNGARGFVTPLATLHAFQGFTDNFLATPASGITDLQAYADYVIKDVGAIKKVKIASWFHDFDADIGNEDLGEEIDFLVAVKPWKRAALSAKYAQFFGADLRPDVSKFWLTFEYKY